MKEAAIRLKNKIEKLKKYIIVEIIPTAISPEKGYVAQISALKLDGLTLIDRFDYRLEENLIYNQDILRMINYDKDKFTYLDSSNKIMEEFKSWSEGLDLLIIDNLYTNNYLKSLKNKKKDIFAYLNLEYSNEVIDEVKKKYNLEDSDYIVDLLYEALIYESNNK